MSLGHGASVVRDGLVFYYDMHNQQKCWKGAPTTNMASDPENLSTWTKSGGITSVTGGFESPDGKNTAFEVVANGTTNSYVAWKGVSIISGNTYTKSVYAKAGTTVTLVFESYDNNGSDGIAYFNTIFNLGTGTYTGTGHTASIENVGNGWYRCSCTRTFSKNVSGGTLYIGSYGSGTGSLYLWRPQTELGTFSTPFVNGTRSNTQAILDLTNKNTITVSNLTYESNNTVNFNSANSYMIAPSVERSSSQVTVSAIVKVDIHESFTRFVNNGWVANGWLLFSSSTLWRFGVADASGIQYNAETPHSSSTNWTHLTGVYDGSFVRLYVNGELRSSIALTTTSMKTGGNIEVGYGNATGLTEKRIDNVKIYNRALSATEIKQNFEALRGRYGI